MVNGENAAGGVGITRKTAQELLDARRRRDHARQPRLPPPRGLRVPRQRAAHRAAGQLPEGQPRARPHGRRGERPAPRASINLSGPGLPRGGALAVRRGRRAAGRAARRGRRGAGRHARRGRPARRSRWAGTSTAACSPASGTHTHVPTADARVLPGGTAYITDVGMTGPRGGVIGVKKELALERFLTLTQVRFETANEDPWLNAVLVEGDSDGRAQSIRQLLVPAERSAVGAEASPPARTARTTRRRGRTSGSPAAAARSAPRRRAPPPGGRPAGAARTPPAAPARPPRP